jgi:hypothetical protein
LFVYAFVTGIVCPFVCLMLLIGLLGVYRAFFVNFEKK